MVSKDRRSIAANAALDMMNELISIMEQAAKQIYDGLSLEDCPSGRVSAICGL